MADDFAEGTVERGDETLTFSIEVARGPGSPTVIVRGEVDLYTAPRLQEQLEALVGDGAEQIAVDLSETTFMDSTGIGVLVGVLNRLRESGGDLVLRAPGRPIRKILDIAGLTEVFTIA